MNAEKILAHCQKVKPTGSGTWIACCPAHDDKTPSMNVREVEDRLLVYCHAGCSAEEIVSACGLKLEDLFPEKTEKDFVPAQRRRFPAADVLEALQAETFIVATAACNIANGVPLTIGDYDRLMIAHARIAEGRRLALG